MNHIARRAGIFVFGLAAADILALHLLPAPMLRATTGALIPYRPWNFLSEFVLTDYAPMMTGCFILLALGALATALALRHLRREAVLLAMAGVSLILLACFPTDLADLTTNAVTCGQPNRIEPCTLVGQIHNPLSTVVFIPVFFVALSFCIRSRREPKWRVVALMAVACGILAVVGVVTATLYMHAMGWHGRWWTGLMQRSIAFPALLWIFGLLLTTKPDATTDNHR